MTMQEIAAALNKEIDASGIALLDDKTLGTIGLDQLVSLSCFDVKTLKIPTRKKVERTRDPLGLKLRGTGFLDVPHLDVNVQIFETGSGTGFKIDAAFDDEQRGKDEVALCDVLGKLEGILSKELKWRDPELELSYGPDSDWLSGKFSGTLLAGKTPFKLSGSFGETLKFHIEMPRGASADLGALARLILPVPLTLPAEIPSVKVEDVAIDLTPERGEYTLSAKSPGGWSMISQKGGLRVRDCQFDLTRTKSGNEHQLGGSIVVHAGPWQIQKDQIVVDDATLTFTRAGEAWSLDARAKLELFGDAWTFTGRYADAPGPDATRDIHFDGKKDSGDGRLVTIGDAHLDADSLAIDVACRDDKYAWGFQGHGTLTMPEILSAAAAGTVRIDVADGGGELVLEPDDTVALRPIEIPRPGGGRTSLTADIEHVRVAVPLTLELRVAVDIDGLPDYLNRKIPGTETDIIPSGARSWTLRVDSKSVSLELDRFWDPVQVPLGSVKILDHSIDLGHLWLEARDWFVTLGDRAAFGATINFALPPLVNALFGIGEDGKPLHRALHAYDQLVQVFTMTENALLTLARGGPDAEAIPPAVRRRLRGLIGSRVVGEAEFRAQIEDAVGAEAAKEYAARILKVAGALAPRDPDCVQTFALHVGLNGLEYFPLSSPTPAVQVKRTKKKTAYGRFPMPHIDVPLGGETSLAFDLPALRLQPSGSFHAAGGWQLVGTEAMTLAPFELLLKATGLEKLAGLLPHKLPFSKLQLVDERGNLRDVGPLLDMVESTLAIKLPPQIKKGAQVIKKEFQLLPESFRRFLHFEVPDDFHLDVTVTPTGAIRGHITTGDEPPAYRLTSQSLVKLREAGFPSDLLGRLMALADTPFDGQSAFLEAVHAAIGDAHANRQRAILQHAEVDWKTPPLRMLLPSGPNLIGIELRGFSIGELAAGTLFLMEVDADIEVFPVVEMLLDLVLGEHRPAFMPETGKLRQSFRLHNVTMLGATAFPVPIPIFFDEIGFEYTGIEGLELETHWGFPLPAIDAASIVGTARKLVDFLGDPQKQLQPGDLNDGDLGRFWSGPNYLQLPSYVGGKLVGSRTDDWEIDFAEQIVPLLNGIKRWDPLDLIRAFPIEKRVRKEGTTLFGFLDLGASWIVTTFDEFQELCEKGAEVRNQVLDELKAMPKRQRDNLIRALPLEGEPHASGLIMLLWGGWGIEGWASMEVSLGMAASGSKGVGTGYGIQGDLGNAAELALSSSAFVSKGSLDLGGHAGLRVADLLILDGSFSLHNDHFAIGVRSRLQVIDGTLRGHLSPSELVLAGDVQVRAGAFFSMNAQARIDSHHGFLVEGKWTYAAGQTQGVTLAAVGADSGLELRAGLETLEFNFVRFEGPALSLMYDPGADALAFRSLRLSGDTTVGAGIARGAGAITMTDPGGDSRLTLSIADGTLFGKYGCSLEATLPTSKFHQGPFDFRVELDKGICDALADAAFELLQFAASNYVLLRQARDFVARKKKLSEIPDEYAKRLNQIPKAMAERIKQVRTSKDLSGIVKKPIRDILKSAEDTLEKCDIRKVERTIEDCVDQLTGSVVGRLGGKEAAREIRKGLSYVRNFVYDQINSFIAQLEKKIPNWVELAPAVAARIAQAKRRDVLAIDGIVWHSSVEAAASRSELDVKVRARVNLDGKKWTPVQEIDLSLDPGRVDAATASLLKAIL